jgi:hypothetical protein
MWLVILEGSLISALYPPDNGVLKPKHVVKDIKLRYTTGY